MATKDKVLLFSLTKKDFEIQTFCTGGPGGQHKNAKQNGVRIIHTASGARAEHRDGRDQAKNKEAAFKKLVQTKTFMQWHRTEVAKCLGKLKVLDDQIDAMMNPDKLKVELY